MRESLEELYRQLEQAQAHGRPAAEAGDWKTAREEARKVLSAGSRLHARLTLLEEIQDDANWVAEVDRSFNRKPPMNVPAQDYDTPLPFPSSGAGASPAKGKGKGRGKGGSPS